MGEKGISSLLGFGSFSPLWPRCRSWWRTRSRQRSRWHLRTQEMHLELELHSEPAFLDPHDHHAGWGGGSPANNSTRVFHTCHNTTYCTLQRFFKLSLLDPRLVRCHLLFSLTYLSVMPWNTVEHPGTPWNVHVQLTEGKLRSATGHKQRTNTELTAEGILDMGLMDFIYRSGNELVIHIISGHATILSIMFDSDTAWNRTRSQQLYTFLKWRLVQMNETPLPSDTVAMECFIINDPEKAPPDTLSTEI